MSIFLDTYVNILQFAKVDAIFPNGYKMTGKICIHEKIFWNLRTKFNSNQHYLTVYNPHTKVQKNIWCILKTSVDMDITTVSGYRKDHQMYWNYNLEEDHLQFQVLNFVIHEIFGQKLGIPLQVSILLEKYFVKSIYNSLLKNLTSYFQKFP